MRSWRQLKREFYVGVGEVLIDIGQDLRDRLPEEQPKPKVELVNRGRLKRMLIIGLIGLWLVCCALVRR